jgi:hypothetical protein
MNALRTTLILTLIFIVMVPIGTLTHEFGHLVAVWSLGADGSISYASTSWNADEDITPAMYMWIMAGGPVQTMLTGTIGFVLLLIYARRRETLRPLHWTMIFMALFWLRQPANMISWLVGFSYAPRPNAVADEIRLARYFDLPDPTLNIVTGTIGLAVLAYITFRIIPSPQRIPFLASGLVGGLVGAWLWFYVVGPWAMP